MSGIGCETDMLGSEPEEFMEAPIEDYIDDYIDDNEEAPAMIEVDQDEFIDDEFDYIDEQDTTVGEYVEDQYVEADLQNLAPSTPWRKSILFMTGTGTLADVERGTVQVKARIGNSEIFCREVKSSESEISKFARVASSVQKKEPIKTEAPKKERADRVVIRYIKPIGVQHSFGAPISVKPTGNFEINSMSSTGEEGLVLFPKENTAVTDSYPAFVAKAVSRKKDLFHGYTPESIEKGVKYLNSATVDATGEHKIRREAWVPIKSPIVSAFNLLYKDQPEDKKIQACHAIKGMVNMEPALVKELKEISVAYMRENSGFVTDSAHDFAFNVSRPYAPKALQSINALSKPVKSSVDKLLGDEVHIFSGIRAAPKFREEMRDSLLNEQCHINMRVEVEWRPEN